MASNPFQLTPTSGGTTSKALTFLAALNKMGIGTVTIRDGITFSGPKPSNFIPLMDPETGEQIGGITLVNSTYQHLQVQNPHTISSKMEAKALVKAYPNGIPAGPGSQKLEGGWVTANKVLDGSLTIPLGGSVSFWNGIQTLITITPYPSDSDSDSDSESLLLTE
jgi:hypothetical protein